MKPFIALATFVTLAGCGLTPEQKAEFNKRLDQGLAVAPLAIAVANLADYDPIHIPEDQVAQEHADCLTAASLRRPLTERRKRICDLVAQAIAGAPTDPAGGLTE